MCASDSENGPDKHQLECMTIVLTEIGCIHRKG